MKSVTVLTTSVFTLFFSAILRFLCGCLQTVFGMLSVDSQLNSALLSIVDGKTAAQFCEKFLSSASLDGHPKDLLVQFFKFCDEYVNGLHQKERYDSNAVGKAEVLKK